MQSSIINALSVVAKAYLIVLLFYTESDRRKVEEDDRKPDTEGDSQEGTYDTTYLYIQYVVCVMSPWRYIYCVIYVSIHSSIYLPIYINLSIYLSISFFLTDWVQLYAQQIIKFLFAFCDSCKYVCTQHKYNCINNQEQTKMCTYVCTKLYNEDF